MRRSVTPKQVEAGIELEDATEKWPKRYPSSRQNKKLKSKKKKAELEGTTAKKIAVSSFASFHLA